MNDLNTIKEYLEEEIRKAKDGAVGYLYYNLKAEEGEGNQYYTLNFLVGEYSKLVNTLKKVKNLKTENEKENIR